MQVPRPPRLDASRPTVQIFPARFVGPDHNTPCDEARNRINGTKCGRARRPSLAHNAPRPGRGSRGLGRQAIDAHRLGRLAPRAFASAMHLILEQIACATAGCRNSPPPGHMFFTPVGGEQATDQWVAAYKASRFPAEVPVADLCCGIGGDLLALALRGPVTGVDRDPAVALLAAADACAVVPQATVMLVATEVESFDVGRFAAWHIDPDRRPEGRRTTRVELHEPGPAAIDRLRAHGPKGPSSSRQPPRCLTPGARRPSSNGSAAAANAGNWFAGSARSRTMPDDAGPRSLTLA